VGGDQIAGGVPQIIGWGCFCTPDRLDKVKGAKEVVLRKQEDHYAGWLVFDEKVNRQWSATGLLESEKEGDKDTEISACVKVIPGSPAKITIENPQGEQIAVLSPGEWSSYVSLKFGQEMGWVRFLLVEADDEGDSLQLFHTMVSRSNGWTKPSTYASALLNEVGPYQQGMEVAGMMERDNWFGDMGMEADIELLRKSGDILIGYADLLMREKPQWDHLYIQLHSSDGLNHRRLGHIDPAHPRTNNKLKEIANKWMLENYKATDAILGKVAKLAQDSDSVLVVVSDHSAVPTHTWVDTARPFQEKGWLHFAADGKWDPTRSKIRKMINHSIYINLKGHQPDGIVEPTEYEKVRDEIILTLLNMKDPSSGECPIAVAARREDLDSVGANGPNFGDVAYFMRPGYTNQPVSEDRLLTAEMLAVDLDNPEEAMHKGYGPHRSIQGNHHDYMPNAEYPGVCSNRAILLFHGPKIRKGCRIHNAWTIDVAPTLATISGINKPAQCEGRVLDDIFE